jgi:hypothetical protein
LLTDQFGNRLAVIDDRDRASVEIANHGVGRINAEMMIDRRRDRSCAQRMAALKSEQQPTVIANIPGLLQELEELGQRIKPVERERSEQPAAMVVKGK